MHPAAFANALLPLYPGMSERLLLRRSRKSASWFRVLSGRKASGNRQQDTMYGSMRSVSVSYEYLRSTDDPPPSSNR